VELNLPMPVQRIAANPAVADNRGLTAIQRGPMIYCIEAADHSEPISRLFLPPGSELVVERDNSLLGGMAVLRGTAEIAEEQDWDRKLYQPAARMRSVPFTAIPYYAWDNRKGGEMKVWLPVAPP